MKRPDVLLVRLVGVEPGRERPWMSAEAGRVRGFGGAGSEVGMLDEESLDEGEVSCSEQLCFHQGQKVFFGLPPLLELPETLRSSVRWHAQL